MRRVNGIRQDRDALGGDSSFDRPASEILRRDDHAADEAREAMQHHGANALVQMREERERNTGGLGGDRDPPVFELERTDHPIGPNTPRYSRERAHRRDVAARSEFDWENLNSLISREASMNEVTGPHGGENLVSGVGERATEGDEMTLRPAATRVTPNEEDPH